MLTFLLEKKEEKAGFHQEQPFFMQKNIENEPQAKIFVLNS